MIAVGEQGCVSLYRVEGAAGPSFRRAGGPV